MQTKNAVLAAGLVATMANPAQANLGQAGNVIFKVFTDAVGGLIDLITNSADASVAYDHFGNVRRDEAPPGVPQQEYDRCYSDITGVTVTASSPEPGKIQFENVPPACMNLANVLIGDPASGPWALPCGSACLSYSDLTEKQFADLAGKIHAVAS